jgi:hypothetical protein
VRLRIREPAPSRFHAPEESPKIVLKRNRALPYDPAPPGGCEGLAMFYRTNLTLSALSNRLNLGTRSLVQTTSLNHGDQALRIRHPYHDVMRDKMAWCAASPFKPGGYDIPCSLGSMITGQEERFVDQAGRVSSHSACQNPVSPGPKQPGRVSQPAAGQREPFFRPARRSPRPAPAIVLALVLGRSPRQAVSEGWCAGLTARLRAIARALALALCTATAVTGV